MGIIKAVVGSTGGVLADQWKEYFYCDAMPSGIIGMRGRKHVSERSSNTKGDDNVITDGSLIVVADGQTAIAVEKGKAFACWNEPGEYEFHSDESSTVFNKGGLKGVFGQIGKRIQFGGDVPLTQRIYYFSELESGAVEFKTPSPVPFRVTDKNIGLDITAGIMCEGSFSYRLTDPIKFYNTICGNFADTYPRSRLSSQLNSEILTSLQSALGQLAENGMRPSEIPSHVDELCEIIKEDWKTHRGLEPVSIGMTVSVTEEDMNSVSELQLHGALRNPTMAAAHLVGAQAGAMQKAAENQSGAVGIGLVNNIASQPEKRPYWACKCGNLTNGKFCEKCGNKRPF